MEVRVQTAVNSVASGLWRQTFWQTSVTVATIYSSREWLLTPSQVPPCDSGAVYKSLPEENKRCHMRRSHKGQLTPSTRRCLNISEPLNDLLTTSVKKGTEPKYKHKPAQHFHSNWTKLHIHRGHSTQTVRRGELVIGAETGASAATARQCSVQKNRSFG